jgi:hypothetical protein
MTNLDKQLHERGEMAAKFIEDPLESVIKQILYYQPIGRRNAGRPKEHG